MTLFIEELTALGNLMTVVVMLGCAFLGFVVGRSRGRKQKK